MSEPTFGEVFRDRLDKVEAAAKAAGINMTVVCKEAGISRATPDRWRRKLPKTAEIIDKMEKVVAKYKAAAAG
jgi:transposase-like protein